MHVSTEALEIRVGVRPSCELPRVAADALAGHSWSPALGELAGVVGLTSGERSRVVEELKEDALRDLGAAELSRETAAGILLRRYAIAIGAGNLSPVDGAAKIVCVVTEMSWDGTGRPHWDAGTGAMYELADMYFGRSLTPTGQQLDEIEGAIREAADRLVTMLPDED